MAVNFVQTRFYVRPCPLCGKAAGVVVSATKSRARVQCRDEFCGCRTREVDEGNVAVVVQQWNRRAGDADGGRE